MGNTQPKNKTGKNVTAQKLENAKKLGVLSLSEHGLTTIPSELVDSDDYAKLRVLDLSHNRLASIGGKLGSSLPELKTLNLDHNALTAGTLSELAQLKKLQNLSLSHNALGTIQSSSSGGHQKDGKTTQATAQQQHQLAIPPLQSPSLKQLSLVANQLSVVPQNLLSLVKLEKLDLSHNAIRTLPDELGQNLVNLQELRLDRNQLSQLPASLGRLKKLKVLSLKHNQFRVANTVWNDDTNPQPLPQPLFTDTPLIDLNLHGNQMTNTQLNEFEGFDQFLERRQKVKNKTMTNLDVCGLD